MHKKYLSQNSREKNNKKFMKQSQQLIWYLFAVGSILHAEGIGGHANRQRTFRGICVRRYRRNIENAGWNFRCS